MSYFFEVIKNYLFIQFSLLFFIAPFYLAYKYTHPEIKFKHLALNKHIEDFLSSPQADYLVFTWALMEAVFWYIIPEFLLLLLVFLRVKSRPRLLLYDILGTFIGTITGIALSTFSHINPATMLYVNQHMVDQVQLWYHALGPLALLFQPFSGIPYKVFVLSIHSFNLNLIWFVVIAFVVRIARYFIFYSIFTGLYPFLHRIISRNYARVFVVSCFIFSVVLLNIYHSYGAGYIVNDRGVGVIKQVILLIKERLP